ncbi:hypothetical protein D3C80_1434770 [compost metagenome]
MVAVGVAETVPIIIRVQRPTLRLVDLLRLPDVEEPAIALLSQPLYLTAEMQCALHRTIYQSPPRIAAQHGCGSLHRCYDAVIRRGGGVHHIGFVKGAFVVVTLNVNH